MKKNIQLNPYFIVILLFLLLVLPFNIQAQIPRQISLQGLLTNADGSRMEDGALSVQFLIYESETGGTAKWTETQNIILKNSIFSTTLGKITPLDIPFDRPYWVGIRIMGNSELTPRIALTSSPYSLGGNSSILIIPDGQTFEIKDSSGIITHAFYSNGNSYHKGKGYFSGIVIGDSSKSFGDTIYTSLSTNYESLSSSNNTLEESRIGAKIGEGNIGLFGWSQSGFGVYGWSNQSYGLYGFSCELAGVYGTSLKGDGIRGHSDKGTGVIGFSQTGVGVFGMANGNDGKGAGIMGETTGKIPAVFGEAAFGEGVKGISSSGNGIYGQSTFKDGIVGESQYGYAGRFNGNVKIDKSLEVDGITNDENIAKFLVWGDDKKVYWRSTPSGSGGTSFEGILNNKPLIVLDDLGIEKLKLGIDGSATFSGLGTFNNGVLGSSISSYGLKGSSTSGYGIWGISKESYGVYGESESYPGVWGSSSTNYGVYGESDSHKGVVGESNTGIGVEGYSHTGAGVHGLSVSQVGVWGESTDHNGVHGKSVNRIGVYGVSDLFDGVVGESVFGWAGRFIGAVKIENILQINQVTNNESLTKFLVWGDDKQVHWRALPSGSGGSFTGVLNNMPLSILNGSGVEVHRLNTDGTQTHSGLSTFNGGATGVTVNSFGLKGESTSSTGVIGNSTSGIGVSGTSVSHVGVKGYSKDQSGVWGLSTDNYGVTGESTNGIGVLGVSTNSTGIVGSSDHGLAGKFVGKVKVEKTLEIDEVPNNESLTKFLVWNDDKIVYWRTLPSGGTSFTGVLNNTPLSILNGSGTEVHRLNTDGTETHSGLSTFNGGAQGISISSFGLKGQSTSEMGIRGISNSGHGVLGESETGSGVVGSSNSSFGVFGQSNSGIAVMGSSQSNIGVSGYSNSGDGIVGQSVSGWSGRFTGKVKVGDVLEVDKVTNNESLTKYLVWGSDNIVYWRSIPTSGSFDGALHNVPLMIYNGVGTITHQLNADGTQTQSGLGTFNAGLQIPLSNGNYDEFSPANGFRVMSGATTKAQICTLGNAIFQWVTKAGGSFRIDHPLDPENKYLSHSFVESPDMMNIYNGNVTLNSNGEATITLPDWFEALNKDFRYQLTCIGGFAQVYIAEEIHNNAFKIAGGKQGLKVSWQVTGVRQDAYANAHRLKVEEVKPVEERGTLLHPEAFGRIK